jgi:hypothetical protein
MTIYEHWQKGHWEAANEKGVLKGNIILYCEINRAFTISRNAGNKYDDAIEYTADAMNVSCRTVKRAIATVNR